MLNNFITLLSFRYFSAKKNEKFVSSAPAAVVDVERKKLADADLKIDALTKALEQLN